ncbi:hypothetical protein [Peribacillus saganii]|uniref:hypothetical protein n=1 Tax=Peribacillus saganii TaxID=2303992 RepID=UPI0018F2293A|nr:hypothetical protein [Peribacillus saganii]
MEYSMNRINPNQTQVIFSDGRFETLTNEELEYLMLTERSSERELGKDSPLEH